jgi:hypothetical protein
MAQTVGTAALLVVIGLVLAGLGVHQLGVVRAALKWPTVDRPRVGRTVATFEMVAGVALAAAGAVVGSTALPVGTLPHLAIGAGLAVVVIVFGLVIAVKATDRVELNALIRTPSPLYRAAAPGSGGHHQSATSGMSGTTPPGTVDSAVPPGARPGWVYQDAAGDWYLTVAVGPGFRLVRLPDFALVSPDPARQLTAAGTVELSVWPLVTDSEGDTLYQS